MKVLVVDNSASSDVAKKVIHSASENDMVIIVDAIGDYGLSQGILDAIRGMESRMVIIPKAETFNPRLDCFMPKKSYSYYKPKHIKKPHKRFC